MWRTFLFPLLLLALLTGCKKELDLDYRDIPPMLVVEANLTDAGSTVALTQTTPMDEPMDTRRLTDAAVTITDLSDGTVTTLAPDATGTYVGTDCGVTGHDYRLTVEREGAVYTSDCRMQVPVEIADAFFQWIKMPYDEVAVFTIRLVDNPLTDDAYWVRIFRNGEVYKWAVFEDRFALDGVVEASMMTARKNPPDPDDEDILNDGDVLTITAVRIPAHIYTYLEQLSAHTIAGPTAISGTPPALGYFLASPVTSLTLTYSPSSF
jgi:putative lipoprotein